MPRDTTPPSFFCLLYFEAICATRLKKSSAQNNRAIRVTVGLRPDGRGCETDIKKPPAFPVKEIRWRLGWRCDGHQFHRGSSLALRPALSNGLL